MSGQSMADVLGQLWDSGNCTGLDGWIGPGRGAGEVDDDALQARDRDVSKALAALSAAGFGPVQDAKADAWDQAIQAVETTIGAYTEEGVWALNQASKLNPNPYRKDQP